MEALAGGFSRGSASAVVRGSRDPASKHVEVNGSEVSDYRLNGLAKPRAVSLPSTLCR